MATQAAGNVQLPKGSVSGVGSPTGAVATNVLNLGEQLLNWIGPKVNGGAGMNPASPLAGQPVAGTTANLPHNAQPSILPVVLALGFLLWVTVNNS